MRFYPNGRGNRLKSGQVSVRIRGGALRRALGAGEPPKLAFEGSIPSRRAAPNPVSLINPVPGLLR